MALLTLLYLEHVDQVPTSIERLRRVSDVIADIAPQGHPPWMRRLLSNVKEDPAEGARPLPWLTPTFFLDGLTMTLRSAGNTKTLGPNKNLSFCPGAIIDGEPQPFVVGSGARHTNLCQNLLFSIANPRVYHNDLHSGSNSLKEFGLQNFPNPSFINLLRYQKYSGYPLSLYRSTPHRGTHPNPYPFVLQSPRTSP